MISTPDEVLKMWEKEYSKRKNLPSTKNTQYPSRALVSFFERYTPADKNLALDLGSGNGRNSFYLVQQAGYKNALGIEFAKPAVDFANGKNEKLGLRGKIRFLYQSLKEDIPLEDESADLIIDMFTMHSLTEQNRLKVLSEIKRVLKPGGFFIISTIGAEGEAAKANMAKNPGPEKNSYRFEVEDSLVTERAFESTELIEFLDPLRLVEIESVEQATEFEGKFYKHIYHTAVFQKN